MRTALAIISALCLTTSVYANTIVVRVGTRGDTTNYTEGHTCDQKIGGFAVIPWCKRFDQESPPTPASVRKIVGLHPFAYSISKTLYVLITVWHQGAVPHVLWHGWWTVAPNEYTQSNGHAMKDFGFIPIAHTMGASDLLFIDVQCFPLGGAGTTKCQAGVEYHLDAE